MIMPCGHICFDLRLRRVKIGKNLTFCQPQYSTSKKNPSKAPDNGKIYSIFVITVSSNLNKVDTYPQAKFYCIVNQHKRHTSLETSNVVRTKMRLIRIKNIFKEGQKYSLVKEIFQNSSLRLPV